jgi:hypothetical protein
MQARGGVYLEGINIRGLPTKTWAKRFTKDLPLPPAAPPPFVSGGDTHVAVIDVLKHT